MEILSYFPLAKLETITERTFINFSTTFCRNVRKQLHQKWLTVLITRASLANLKLYRFSSFKTLHSMMVFVILQLTVSIYYYLFKSTRLHRFSGAQTFYNQWKNLYSLELHTSRKRLLPADCSAVSFLDHIQWNSQLAVKLYLPVRLNSLHWHKLFLLHFLTPFLFCPTLFLSPFLSPHSLSHLFFELYHVSKLIIQCPVHFLAKTSATAYIIIPNMQTLRC